MNTKEYNKAYYEKNKEKLREKVMCNACNKEIAKWNLASHQKTKKHRKLSETPEDKLNKAKDKLRLIRTW